MTTNPPASRARLRSAKPRPEPLQSDAEVALQMMKVLIWSLLLAMAAVAVRLLWLLATR